MQSPKQDFHTKINEKRATNEASKSEFSLKSPKRSLSDNRGRKESANDNKSPYQIISVKPE